MAGKKARQEVPAPQGSQAPHPTALLSHAGVPLLRVLPLGTGSSRLAKGLSDPGQAGQGGHLSLLGFGQKSQ